MTINEQIVWSVILIISVAINIVQYYNTHHMKREVSIWKFQATELQRRLVEYTDQMKEIRKENKWDKD